MADVTSVGTVRDGRPLVVPQVRQLTPSEGTFALPETLAVEAPKELDLTPLVNVYAQMVPNGKVERATEEALCRFELTTTDVPESPEGYRLKITEKGLSVAARDVHGLHNGMQTLGWLIRNRLKQNELQNCAIDDWPDLKMRGLYLQLHSITSSQVERICHVIDVLSILKYNTLLISFDSNFPFTGLPFTGREKPPLSRKDVDAILAAARRNHMEVIPCVQLVSHTAWMKSHRDWANLREGNNDHGYCLSNPDVQPVIEQLVRDVLDVFQPRYFHIGLDEYEQGGLPACPKCKSGNLEELILNHLRPILAMFAERGVTPIIFQDQFFGFGEPTLQRGLPIKNLPEKLGQDIIINSWEYWHFPSDARAKEIRARGFNRLLYMSFAISADNCQNLPKVALRTGALGNIVAYWSMMPATMSAPDWPFSEFYPSFIANANYCWNANDIEFSSIPIDSAQLFMELLDGKPERAFRGKASRVPLDGVLNRAFANDSVFPKLDGKTTAEMRRLAAADPADFDLRMGENGAPLAVVLSGTEYDGFATEPATIPVGTKATGASFLMTAAMYNKFLLATSVYAIKRVNVGTLRIVYADGQTEEIPLTTQRTINDWNSYLAGNSCRVVLRGNDRNGAIFSLYAIDWRNPRPEEEIREIVLTSNADSFFAPALFAVSLSDAAQPPVGADGPMSIAPPPHRTEFKAETAVGFQDGLPEGIKATGSGTKDFKIKLAHDTQRGNVLEMSMAACESYLARPLVDLPLKNPQEFESVSFDIRISNPQAVFRPDFYLMDSPIAHELGDIGFFLETDDQWHTVCIPRQRFPNAAGGLTPETAAIMSLRFFMHQWPTPVTMQISDIKYLNGVLPSRVNITRPVK